MAHPSESHSPDPPRRRYTWPWFVLLGFVAAVALAILWLSFEVRRTQRIRDLNEPTPQQHP